MRAANPDAEQAVSTAGDVDVARLGHFWRSLFGRDHVPPFRKTTAEICARVQDYEANLVRVSHSGGASKRLTARAVLAGLAGLLLVCTGGIGMLGLFPEMAQIISLLPRGGELPFALIGLPLFVTGAGLLRYCEQLMQPGAHELLAADTRPSVLLLRSFADDDLLMTQPREGLRGEKETSAVRFEVAIARRLSRLGPLIAIGRPGEALSLLGAARAYFTDETWQENIRSWMDRSQLIVVIPGLTNGVRWEIAELISRSNMHKVLFVFPPRAETWHEIDDRERARRAGVLRETLSTTPLGEEIAKLDPADLISFHTMPSGGVQAYRSADQSAFDYEMAIELAVYAMLAAPSPAIRSETGGS